MLIDSDHFKELAQNGITDGVLREFIFKDLLTPSIQEIDSCISRREEEIQILKNLRSELTRKEMLLNIYGDKFLTTMAVEEKEPKKNIQTGENKWIIPNMKPFIE